MRAARMRAGLCFMALAWLVARTRGDGCWPGDYLINGGQWYDVSTQIPALQLDSYCTGASYGGDGGWTWVAGGCAKNGNIGDMCPCHSDGEGAGCTCGSSHASSIHMCYQQSAPCVRCTSGQYRVGCGCGDCRGGAFKMANGSTITAALFYGTSGFGMDNKCANWPFATGLVCGKGSCAACPPGYMCDPVMFHAAPCPAGMYQPSANQTACKLCALGANQYLVFDYDHGTIESACDPVRGYQSTSLSCGKCTQLPQALLDKFPNAYTCPGRDLRYGVYKNGGCRPCTLCYDREYARPGTADNYCVTDNSTEQCRLLYNANTATADYACVKSVDPATGIAAYSCRNSNELQTEGAMPWQAGFRRTLTPDAWRYQPGVPNMGGLLPYYQPCPGYSLQPPFRARNKTSDLQQLQNRSWDMDCDIYTTRECVPDHYAVLGATTDAAGVTIVEDCLPCVGGHSPGGLQTFCVCNAGNASRYKLEAIKQWRVYPIPEDQGAQACYNCSTDFLLATTGGAARFEAFVCNASQDLYQRCTGPWEYALAAGCGSCRAFWGAPYTADSSNSLCGDAGLTAPRPIPMANRTGCFVCPPGTYIVSGLGCVPCPAKTFQPLAGQCQCLPKRTHCGPGQRLHRSPEDDANVLSDIPCVDCDLACPVGSLTIRAPQFNSSVSSNTCDGSGHYYFACFVDPTHGGQLPDLAAGERVEFPPNYLDANQQLQTEDVSDGQPPSAVMSLCDATLLPPDSAFVTHHVDAVGVQCYLACLYGANPSAAAAHHQQMRALAGSTHPELKPFLIDGSEKPYASTLFGQTKGVHIPAVWRMDGAYAATLGDDLQWLVSDFWTSGAGAQVDFRINTFLFHEAAPPAHGLCIPAADAFAWPPPKGIVCTTPRVPPPCALHARTQLIRVTSPSTKSAAYAVMDPRGPPDNEYAECLAPNTNLTKFNVGCDQSCLDVRRQHAMVLAASQSLVIAQGATSMYALQHGIWGDRLQVVAYFLQADFWQSNWNGQLNPYTMPDTAGPQYEAVWVFTGGDTNAPPSTAATQAGTTRGTSAAGTSAASNATAVATTAPFATVATTSAATLPTAVLGNGTCRTFCAIGAPVNTFRYEPGTAHAGDGTKSPRNANLLAGLSVCVPCDYQQNADTLVSYGSMVCASLFNPPRFFDNERCIHPPLGTTELTTDIVCSSCAFTMPLANGAVATLIPPSSDLYATWWGTRSVHDEYNHGGSSGWSAITCQYSCPRVYTSNANNPSEYKSLPCVPCHRSCPLAADATADDNAAAQFFNEPYGPCGQTDGNVAPYTFTCATCSDYWLGITKTPMYLFIARGGVGASPMDCYARCDPARYLGYVNGLPFDDYTPLSNGLTCVSCAVGDRSLMCGGGCDEGYYNTSATTCGACNASACPAEGLYRQSCRAHASIRDAECVPCANASLFNGEIFFAPESNDLRQAMAVPELLALARDTRGQRVRRWVTAADRATS